MWEMMTIKNGGELNFSAIFDLIKISGFVFTLKTNSSL